LPVLPLDDENVASVQVPSGEWELTVMSKNTEISVDVIAFSFVGFLLSLIGGVFAWYMAIQPKKLNHLVLKKTVELRQLSAHLQIVREEERTRIAREIHDDLGQQLTGLKMDASWIRRKAVIEDEAVKERLSGMILLIDTTVKTVRRISSELRPGILDDLGLIAALEWQGLEFEKRTGIRFRFDTELNDLDLEINLATNIFRIFQEALNNITRHSEATEVEIKLSKARADIEFIIRDNGKGFDLNAQTKSAWGLIGMKERAIILNGKLSIRSEQMKGTSIRLLVPLLERTQRE
jgi:signal transduction histidine kinase